MKATLKPVDARLTDVDGRRMSFAASAHDGVDRIGEGTHQRVVEVGERFNERIAKKKPVGEAVA